MENSGPLKPPLTAYELFLFLLAPFFNPLFGSKGIIDMRKFMSINKMHGQAPLRVRADKIPSLVLSNTLLKI